MAERKEPQDDASFESIKGQKGYWRLQDRITALQKKLEDELHEVREKLDFLHLLLQNPTMPWKQDIYDRTRNPFLRHLPPAEKADERPCS